MTNEECEELTAMERRARMFEAANEKMLADNKRLREENARLREALQPLALKTPIQLTLYGRDFIQAITVTESELNAARAAFQDGGREVR